MIVNEIVHGALAANELLPVQQVGEDFQKCDLPLPKKPEIQTPVLVVSPTMPFL